MVLTQAERKKIYHEEKARREGHSSSGSLFILNILAVLGLFGLYSISKKRGKPKIDLEAFRKAYDSFSPSEDSK